MTGTSSGSASKQQEPEDLAGAAIEPEDEEGLSASEVCKLTCALQRMVILRDAFDVPAMGCVACIGCTCELSLDPVLTSHQDHS